MPEFVLAILKYVFLLLIFLFLARAVRVMSAELTGIRPRGARRAPTAPERMIVSSPDGSSRTFLLDDELFVGRAAKCQVVLEDTFVSEVHARVFRRDGAVFVEDLGSTNGTSVNRRKITQATSVSQGDRALVGKTELEFR